MLQLWRKALPHLADVPGTRDPHREHAARELLIDIRDVVRAGHRSEAVAEEAEIEVESASEGTIAEGAVASAVLENWRSCLQTEQHRLCPLVRGKEDRVTIRALLLLYRLHRRTPASPRTRNRVVTGFREQVL